MNNISIRWFVSILVIITFLLPTVNATNNFKNSSEEQETNLNVINPRVELTEMRTSNTKFFPNPDGTTTAEIYIGPVHYRDGNGNWQDIDTTIQPYEDPDNGYEFACEENGLKAYFKNDYSDTDCAVKTAVGNNWLAWEPLGMSVVDANGAQKFDASVNDVGSEIEGNEIRYRNAFPNTIDEYIVGLNKLKHNFLLTNSPEEFGILDTSNNELTLDYYGYLEYSDDLSLYMDNEELIINSNALTITSGLEFRNVNNEVVFKIPAPVAYEQDDTFDNVECRYELQARYSLVKNGILFSIKTPYSWLAAPERQYPVVIDPSIDTIQPGPLDGKDSFLITGESESGQDQRKFNIGADPEFWITLDSSSQPIRGIIQFSFSNLPLDAEITQADLEIYCHNAPATDSLTIDVFRVTRDWVEGDGTSTGAIIDSGVNWNTTDGTTPWNTPGGDHDAASSGSTPVTNVGWYTWDISQLVTDWHSGAKDNYGALLIGAGGDPAIKILRTSDHTTPSERPKIEVTYVSNYKPVVKIDAIDNLQFSEDDPIKYVDLNSIFDDQDVDDTLTFSIKSGDVWVEVGSYDSVWLTAEILTNDSVEITPKPNKFGGDTIELNATDIALEFAHHSITVTILPVNDPPILNNTNEWKIGAATHKPEVSTGTVKIKEDVFINLTVTAYDPVEPSDTLTFSDNTTLFDISSTSGLIAFRPTNDDVGKHYVKITVNDGGSINNIDFINIIFEVVNQNDPPRILKFIHGITVDSVIAGKDTIGLEDDAKQNQYYNFTIVAEDDDMLTPAGDTLDFEVTPAEKFVVKKDIIDPTKVNVSFLPANEDVGEEFEAEVMVTDLINSFAKIKIKFEVKNINDPPEIIKVIHEEYDEEIDEETEEVELEAEHEATEHVPYTFTVQAKEIDSSDEVEFSTDNSLFKITDNDEETDEDENIIAKDITFTPSCEYGRLGYAVVEITVKDNSKTSDHIIVNISVKNQNDPPVVTDKNLHADTNDSDPSTRKTEENLTWTFEAKNVVDPDGDLLFYYWDFDADDGSTDDEDEEGRWVMWTYEEGGIYTVTLTVVDSKGGVNSTSKTNTVIQPETTIHDTDSDLDAGIPFEWLILIIVIVLVIIVIVAVLVLKKRRKEEGEEEEDREMSEAPSPGGYPYQYGAATTPGMMTVATAAAPDQQQYGGLTAEQYAQYQQYQQMYPTLTIEQFSQYLQQMAAMTPEQNAQYQQQSLQMMQQQNPEQYQQYVQQYQQQQAYGIDMQGVQTDRAALTAGGAADGGEGGLSLPPAAATENEELQAKLPPETEEAPEPEQKPKIRQPKLKSTPRIKSAGTSTETAEGAGEGVDVEETEGEGEEIDTCSNCGTPIKSGWFICPECKNPIV